MRNVERYACMCKDGEGPRDEDEHSEARDVGDEGGDRERVVADYDNTVDQRGYLGECDDQVYSQ